MINLKTAALLIITYVFMSSASAHAGQWIDGVANSAYGARQYKLWVPKNYKTNSPRPIVMALHGCQQSPESFAGLTRLNQYAERFNLLVLYPAQASLANYESCWNWFLPMNQSRDGIETSLAMQMLNFVSAKYSVDKNRVYVFGLSAGAHMAAALMACYNDVFAAGMIASGGMFRAAINVNDAFKMRENGSAYSPLTRGKEAFRCSGSRVPRQMPTLVFQGADDPYNNKVNAVQATEQFAVANDLGDDGKLNGSFSLKRPHVKTGKSPGGKQFEVRSYLAGRKVLMQAYLVDGMGHAWSGGDPKFKFADPAGPNETAIMLDFFSRYTLPKN